MVASTNIDQPKRYVVPVVSDPKISTTSDPKNPSSAVLMIYSGNQTWLTGTST